MGARASIAIMDALYGSGASTAFADGLAMPQLPGLSAQPEQSRSRDGSVHVEIAWRDSAGVPVARCAQDCWPKRIHYCHLSVIAALQGRGLYRQLIVGLLPLYRSWGIEAITASPATARSEYLLALGGFQWVLYDGQPHFGVLLTAESRMDEYLQWVKGGEVPASEPAWHRELREHPVEGPEQEP